MVTAVTVAVDTVDTDTVVTAEEATVVLVPLLAPTQTPKLALAVATKEDTDAELMHEYR